MSALHLDRQLCFLLYSLSREVTRRYQPLLKELGLTYPQYLVMLVLWEHGTLRLGDIGERLQLDSGTLTPLVKKLEAAGLVVRRRNDEDERELLVELTKPGRALRGRAERVPELLLCALNLDGPALKPLFNELKSLSRQLHKEKRPHE